MKSYMAKSYDHKRIERKWQKHWDETGAFTAQNDTKKPKYYPLIEFPYPSGAGLHVGHPRPYIGLDLIARKRRQEGYNVLYPIGWDAFGLPTENFAIKEKKDPRQVTQENTDTFRRQIKQLGISFDWSREINTTEPSYYKWTQWIFLQMYKHGLAYKAKASINWCPKDKIGLANEEVVDGFCERCGSPVEKREREQWMLAITKYAKRLYDDLDTVDYIEHAKVQQRNWIGPSEGAEISFQLSGGSFQGKNIRVFTTRPDTLFGATYMVLAPEHALIASLLPETSNEEEILEYIEASKKKTDIERVAEGKEKTGVELKGVKAVNPATNDEIPIFIADYVLASYGTGAIMAVPAHDTRDYAFAKKFDLPVKEVVEPVFMDTVKEGSPFVEREAISAIVKHWKEDKYIGLKWKKVAWGTFITGGVEKGQTPEEAAIAEIREETGYQNLKLVRALPRSHSKFFHVPKGENRFAHFHNFYFELENEEKVEVSAGEQEKHEVLWLSPQEVEKFLTPEGQRRDWHMLRGIAEAYVGAGILVNSGSFDGLPSEEAKKKITEFVGGEWKTTYKLRDWVFSRQRYWGEPIPMVRCESEEHGWVPVPESDLPVTLPEVKEYQPTDTGESPLANITAWVDTTCPKCGGRAKRETDVMPNWAGSSWYYLRYCDPENSAEIASPESLKYWTPVDWYKGGMEHTVLHLLYSRFWHKFLFDIGAVPTPEPYAKRTSHGLILAEDGEKMSKSRGNVVNPDEIVTNVGADTLRVYEMFMGPFDQPIRWSTDNMIGSRRFLEHVWNLQIKVRKEEVALSTETEVLLNETIKGVGEDIEKMKFNTAVSKLMILTNAFDNEERLPREAYATLVSLLSPFAPHIAEELWSEVLGKETSIQEEPWPEADEKVLGEKTVHIVIQVNSKIRGSIRGAADISPEEIEEKAKALPEVSRLLEGKSLSRVIHVPGRLVNFVVVE